LGGNCGSWTGHPYEIGETGSFIPLSASMLAVAKAANGASDMLMQQPNRAAVWDLDMHENKKTRRLPAGISVPRSIWS